MSHASQEGYRFSDGVPIDPIEPGTSVLVAGPAMSPAEDLALRLVTDGYQTGDGSLYISTNMSSERLLADCQRIYPEFDFTSAAVVDCSGQDVIQSEYESQIKFISTQSDLTGIGMKFSALYEALYLNSNGPVRTGLVSLSSLSMFVDLRKLFRFLQTLSGRIESAGGLGVFAIDPTTHDTKTINTLSQVTDGRIQVRESEDGASELRVRGLPRQPNDWQSFSLST